MFRLTDTFHINEYGSRDYVSYRFISGLNVVGYYCDEHNIHNYLLSFSHNSKHLPDNLKGYLPESNGLYLWCVEDGYWAVEPDRLNFLMSFFHREKARMYLPWGTEWPYEDYLVRWASKNKKWDEYCKLWERWQSGNAPDC